MFVKINKKDTFQDINYFKNHRCFIISDISSENKYLAVNVSSVYSDDGYDNACIITENDLAKFIYKRPFIYYRYADEVDCEIILDDKTTIYTITDDLLKKIQNGAKISKFFPRKYKKYFDLF